jgi:hypothetical protein
LPDALLLAEPKSAKERDLEFTKALENGITDPIQLATLNTYDPGKIQVYREAESEQAGILKKRLQLPFSL